MIPTDVNGQLFRGRAATWRQQFFTDAARTVPVNFTGATAGAAIGTPDGKITLTAAVVNSGGITPADGYLDISITAENAALLTGTYYPWTITRTLSGATNPVAKGHLTIETDDSL